MSSAYPQWCQGFDSTFSKGIESITHARRIARNAPYERTRYLLVAENDPGTPNKVVVVAVVNHISWATVRPGPSKRVGGLMGTVDVVVVVVAVVHHTAWAAVRAGPS